MPRRYKRQHTSSYLNDSATDILLGCAPPLVCVCSKLLFVRPLKITKRVDCISQTCIELCEYLICDGERYIRLLSAV